MILIKPDHSRRVEIPGVPQPVRRPVDINQSTTGFTKLRTLRIYRFEQDSVIEGHAEEDEVYIVVLGGSIALTMKAESSLDIFGPTTLSAPDSHEGAACVAYLPPGSAYKLVAKAEADVAYARATPASIRLPQVFSSLVQNEPSGVSLLFEDTTYAERLRLRLVRVDAQQACASFSPVGEMEAGCEQLLHVRAVSPAGSAVASIGDGPTTQIDSWDTIAVAPGARPILEFAKGAVGLVLVVMAA